MFSRFFLLLCAIAFSSQVYALNLTAKVDRTTISINESLRLVIAVDETANENIDLSQLNSQFEIINQQRSQRQQIVNGQISALTQWILILAPKETGDILIPSFRYKNVFSNPIEISVTQAQTQNDPSSSDVFLEITADKTSAYVQEQILLKTRLYYKISLSSYDAPELALKDTTIELVNEVSYKTTLNNERYQVLELIHALSPQTSGELTIPKLRWRLEKPSRGFFDRSGNPFLFVQSNDLTLSIKPIPAASTAKDWLPSTAVTLTPKWEQSPQTAKVGEPLNLSLTLTANGLSASQLPEINLPTVDKLQIFKERSTTDDIKSGRGIIGSRKSEFTIIPKENGEINLPEIRLKWWNVNTNKEEQVTLQTQTLTVAISNLAQDKLPEVPNLNKPIANENSAPVHSSFWRAIAFILIPLLLGLLYFLYQLNKRNNIQLVAHQFPEKASLHNIEIAIQRCIDETNLEQLPLLLIQWARNFFDDASIKTTTQLGEKIPELNGELKALNNALYGNNKKSDWQASTILSTLTMTRKNKTRKSEQERLKPLYR